MIQTLRALARTRAFRLVAATGLVSLGLGLIAELVDELRSDVTELAASLTVAATAAARADRDPYAPLMTPAPAYPTPEDLAPLHAMAEYLETADALDPE